jgi:hypothetical protein
MLVLVATLLVRRAGDSPEGSASPRKLPPLVAGGREQNLATPWLNSLRGDSLPIPVIGERNLIVAYLTRCPFCELSLDRWRELFGQACGFANVILVSSEPIDIQRAYWKKHPEIRSLDCPNIHIGEAVDEDLFAAKFGVDASPTYIITDSRGTVLGRFVGAVTDANGVKRLLRVLRR